MKGWWFGTIILTPFLISGSPDGGPPAWKAWGIEDLAAERAESGRAYMEFLRAPDISAGLYELSMGQKDLQSPHGEDEIYYVVEGKATFRASGETTKVRRGSVLYVRAGVEHRFEEITEDLKILVVFAASHGK